MLKNKINNIIFICYFYWSIAAAPASRIILLFIFIYLFLTRREVEVLKIIIILIFYTGMKTTVHRTSASIADALCTPSPVHSTSVVLNGVHRRSAPKECRLQVVCTLFYGAPDPLFCHVERSTRLRLTTCICTAARSLWLQFWIT